MPTTSSVESLLKNFIDKSSVYIENLLGLIMSNTLLSLHILVVILIISICCKNKFKIYSTVYLYLKTSFWHIWFVCVFILISYLLYHNKFSEISFKELTGEDIIFLLWLAILIFPILTRVKLGNISFIPREEQANKTQEQFDTLTKKVLTEQNVPLQNNLSNPTPAPKVNRNKPRNNNIAQTTLHSHKGCLSQDQLSVKAENYFKKLQQHYKQASSQFEKSESSLGENDV